MLILKILMLVFLCLINYSFVEAEYITDRECLLSIAGSLVIVFLMFG